MGTETVIKDTIVITYPFEWGIAALIEGGSDE